ncbi:MAG: ABC transporter ATP-binding protein/permease [Lachnospiraceae bacterium]|nr:ABC transporter ATP-binding protein/permease [Lachnospiraceae bacterium]
MKSKQKTWREMIKLNSRAFGIIYQRYPAIILSRLASVAWNALTPYAGIYLSALIIDELAGARDPERLRTLVVVTLMTAAVIALGTAFLNKWKETQNAGLWLKVDNVIAQKLFDMDYIYLDQTHTAELLTAIEQNRISANWGLCRVAENCESLFSAIFTILGGVSLTVTLFVSRVPEGAGAYTLLNHPLFIVALIAVMLLITLTAPALDNKAESYWAVNSNAHKMGNRLFSFFGFLGYKKEIAADVRMYRQDRMCDRYNIDKKDTFGSDGLFAHLSRGPIGLYSAASAGVSVVFTGVVYVFVCLKAWAGAFGLGSVTQYVASVTKVSGGMSGLVSTLGDMRNNAAFLEVVFELLDIPNTMYQGSLTVEKRRDRKYEVVFHNVSFKYPGSDNYALRNVNMKFEIGRRLAVVGMNGSGKTTFIKLLCRLYDPTEGEILLNGIDIRKYKYTEYMDIFSVVFQDFKLFPLKLGENVAGGSGCDRERTAECLRKAGFAEKLAKMPDGIETYLYKDYDKDGVNVSGGEAQKIAIARALYKDAPFIILDEPTAALDPVAEAEIYSKFDEIAGDKTAIYISHRLSSCKFCDEIAVFHEGTVVQYGTHVQLVADESGKYHELWNAQAQYYTDAV